MNEIKFRLMNENDDVSQVSFLLVQADPYIYSPLWGDLDNQVKAFSYLIQNMPCFSYDHILIALKDEIIVGALLFLKRGDTFCSQIAKETYLFFDQKVPKEYELTLEGYFKPTFNFDTDYYLFNVSTDLTYRNLGIASGLLKKFIRMCPKDSSISLEVVTENVNALRLYENYGFRAYDEFQTFYLLDDGHRSLKMILHKKI